MMFGGDDDDDFTPGSSSKLASLFGIGKSSEEGNTSLTYTAPKQPKKGRGETQNMKSSGSTQTSSPAKLSIIIVKAVHTYKLADGNYNAQGKLGAAVLGNAASRVYQLLLYKGKQQHVTSTRITPTLQFVVQANNYATFYDDQMQNWSIMFESSDDAVEFAKEIGLARSNAASDQGCNFITQDLLFGVGSGASDGDSVEVRYVVFSVNAGKLGQEVDNTTKLEKPQRVKLKKDGWEEGLLGVAKGCKRMIVLPPARVGPWKTKIPADCGGVVEVDIGRIKFANKSREGTPSFADSGDSAVDSSTDDTSIRARGASISEALSNSPKTHKASIISRMARMGQATLPLKGAIVCNPSDSEETEEELSGPGDNTPSHAGKVPVKVRLTKSRPSPSVPQEKPIPNVTLANSVSGGMLPQQVAVYQPLSVPWQQQPQPQQQFVRTNGSMTYVQPQGQLYPLMAQQAVTTQQMYPLSPATVSTPPAVPSPDSHLSVFLAETRTQNTEVRMGVAKVVDKVDQVLLKLDTMQQQQHHRQSLPNVMGAMEPSALLASIQKLVNENEQLRSDLEEKRRKNEEQNEKIYQLLHTNQKYLEQSNSMMEQRQDAPLQALVLALQQEKAKLGTDLNEAQTKVSALELQMGSAQNASQELSAQLKQELERSKQIVQDQEHKLLQIQIELQSSTKSLADLQNTRSELEIKLQQTTNDYEQRINDLVSSHQAELSKLTKFQQTASNSLEEEWARKLVARTDEVVGKYTGMVRGLEQENASLRGRIKTLESQGNSSPSSSTIMSEVKKVMNLVYHTLQPQFVPDTSYDGLKIRQTLMATIRDVTLKYIEMKSEKADPLPSQSNQSNAESVSITHSSDVVSAKIKDDAVQNKFVSELEDKKEQTSEIFKAQKEDSTRHLVTPSDEQISTKIDNTINESTSISKNTSADESTVSRQNITISVKEVHTGDIGDEEIKSKTDDITIKSVEKDVTGNSAMPVQKVIDISAKENIKKETTLALGEDIVESKEDNSKSSTLSVEQDKLVSKVDSVTKESISVAVESDSISHTTKEKEKHSRDSSLERSWRPQPPPPPLFDDDDEDDDWLS